MSKKLLSYIEDRSQVLDEVIEDLAASWIFNVKKHGVTFLFPDDDRIAEIQELANTDENAALNALRSHVITDNLSSPIQWNSMRDDIYNLIGNKVPISSVDGRRINLQSGACIELDQEFPRTANISVYNVLAGNIDEGVKTGGRARRPRAKKVAATVSNAVDVRKALYRIAENTSMNVQATCLGYVCSFIQFLISSRRTDVLQCLVPYLDYCPITSFILLFEPSKRQHHFVDTLLLQEWWADDTTAPKNARNIFQRTLAASKNFDSIAYKNAGATSEALLNLRDEILEQPGAQILLKSVMQAYNDLVFKNQIESDGDTLQKILPEQAASYMKARSTESYNLKLVQDEIRVRVEIDRSEGDATALLNGIRCLPRLPTLTDSRVAASQTPQAFVGTLSAFINSTYFLYMLPHTAGQFGGSPGFYNDATPTAEEPIDPVPSKMESLKHIPNAPVNVNELISNLKALSDLGEQPSADLQEAIRKLLPDSQ